MAFNHSLARTQVAAIVAHAGGEENVLSIRTLTGIPAIIAFDKIGAGDAHRGTGARGGALVTIARATWVEKAGAAAKLPVVGETFVDSEGRLLRIQEDRTVPRGATLVYVCGSYAALAA